MAQLRVLLIEDSEDDALLLTKELQRAGLDVATERIETREALKHALVQQSWDLIVSDYTMPHFRGTEALQMVKELGLDVPFIFASGTIQEETAVEAMRAGAHDYMMKGNLKRFAPAVKRELAEAEGRRKRRAVEKELRLRDARMRALHEINVAITSTLDLSSVLALLLEKIDLLLPYSATAIRLYNKEKQFLEPAACRHIDETKWKLRAEKGFGDPPNTVFASRTPLFIQNVQADPQIRDAEFYRDQGLVSYMGFPLIAKDETLGTLGLYTKEEHEFSEDEIQLLGTLAGQVAVAIHHSRLYEATKLQALELERSNRVKNEFLSVMSHELRTPLTVVTGYTSLIQDGAFGDVNQEIKKALGTITSNSNDLLKLISSILETTRIEAGEATLMIEEVDLTEFVGDLERMFGDTANEQTALSWNFSPDLPLIKTDGEKLRQILENLINNAIKFTVEGSVAVSAHYFPEKHEILFSVSDTGIGIPYRARELIFEKFAQGDSSDNRPHDGAGLGLFLVKKFTELLGGKIAVKSELGKGSCFTVRIPAETSLTPRASARPEEDQSFSQSGKGKLLVSNERRSS
jgi:signal transduction histidine kinase/CheY-like chemotaxis protein